MAKKTVTDSDNVNEESRFSKIRNRFSSIFSRKSKDDKTKDSDSLKDAPNNSQEKIDEEYEDKISSKPIKRVKIETRKDYPYSQIIETEGKAMEDLVESFLKVSFPVLLVLAIGFCLGGLLIGLVLGCVWIADLMALEMVSEGFKDKLKDLPNTELKPAEEKTKQTVDAYKELTAQKNSQMEEDLLEKSKAEKEKINNLVEEVNKTIDGCKKLRTENSQLSTKVQELMDLNKTRNNGGNPNKIVPDQELGL